MQDLLTTAIEIVAISFAVVMAIDFVNGLRYVAQPAQVQDRAQTEPEAIAQRSHQRLFAPTVETFEQSAEDPWMLPVDEVLTIPDKSVPVENMQISPDTMPLRLLPPSKSVSVQPPALPVTVKPALDELLAGVDLDSLKLRPARKIAKLLNIPQKLNSKDKPLGFLRAQIKAELQQLEEVPAEAIEAVRGLLAS